MFINRTVNNLRAKTNNIDGMEFGVSEVRFKEIECRKLKGRGERIRVQGYPWLPSKLEASLGYMRLSQEK